MSTDVSVRRQALYSLLGDLPARDLPISCELVREEERENYILEVLNLEINDIEPVPAYYVKPKNVSGKRPAVLYNHAHGGGWQKGKGEMTEGCDSLQDPPYAEVLTGLGYSALCIDCWNFGHRAGRQELDLFKDMIWHGQVLWGMMVYDSIRALDYLCSRPEVDTSHVGTLGLSMGSTMAWWVAALDERIACCVDICCLTDFHELIRTRALDKHGSYYFVPSLLKEWTTAKINALIAPRPHLALAGNYDVLTPPAGLDVIDAELKDAYASAGAPENWSLLRYPCGHVETPDMRQQIIRWLKKHLG